MCSVLQSCDFSFAGLIPIIDYIVVVKSMYISCACRIHACILDMKAAFDHHDAELFSLEGWAFSAALRCFGCLWSLVSILELL